MWFFFPPNYHSYFHFQTKDHSFERAHITYITLVKGSCWELRKTLNLCMFSQARVMFGTCWIQRWKNMEQNIVTFRIIIWKRFYWTRRCKSVYSEQQSGNKPMGMAWETPSVNPETKQMEEKCTLRPVINDKFLIMINNRISERE